MLGGAWFRFKSCFSFKLPQIESAEQKAGGSDIRFRQIVPGAQVRFIGIGQNINGLSGHTSFHQLINGIFFIPHYHVHNETTMTGTPAINDDRTSLQFICRL